MESDIYSGTACTLLRFNLNVFKFNNITKDGYTDDTFMAV